MSILTKTTRWLDLSDEPEEIIIEAATKSAEEKWNERNYAGAERDLREAKSNINKYRNRYSGTQKETLTSTPVRFTGKTMRDTDGNTCEVMLMSDGTEYGCPSYAKKDMQNEMNEYALHQTSTPPESKLGLGDAVGILLTILMLVFIVFIVWLNIN